MMVFPIWIEHALDVAVQGSHVADPREHRRAARRGDQDQRLHGRLPLCSLMLGFWQLRDVVAGIFKGDEVATARQRYWIVEGTFPAAASHSRAVAMVPNPNLA
jgi:hypothetical protein